MHERKVKIAVLITSVYHCASQLLKRQRCWVDQLILLVTRLRRLVFSRLTDLFVDRAQHTIHEFTAILSAKCLRELNSFIDGHLRRHLIAITKKKLV